jgi:hypothetical protein
MNPFLVAVTADPKAWVAALLLLLSPVGALWRYHAGKLTRLRDRVEACERERALLTERLGTTREQLAVERGRVDALTDLFKKEANIG